MKLGVIIGRFQVPELHPGHKSLIQRVKELSDEVLILVGTSAYRNRRNPLTFNEVESMLHDSWPGATNVAMIKDQPTNEVWSKQVDEVIHRVIIHEDSWDDVEVTLYGSRDSFIPCYSGKHKTVELDCIIEHSGTDVRNDLRDNQASYTTSSRKATIAAWSRQHEVVPVAVDVVYTCTNNLEGYAGKYLLLGRKKVFDGWRLPGGFVDKEDESLIHTAIRELKEETNLFVTKEECTLKEGRFVKDWRFRTPIYCPTVSVNVHKDPIAKPGDDLVELKWFKVGDPIVDEIFPGHLDVVTKVLNGEDI